VKQANGITAQQVREAIQALQLHNHTICVHGSLRSFGWVNGGPRALIDGLLAAGCTVLMPTFSDIYAVAPLPWMQRAQNGTDYEWVAAQRWPGVDKIYTRHSNSIEVAEMGLIPQSLLQIPGRIRGDHPLCSFSAIGPHAEELIQNQRPLTVNAPLAQLAAVDGWVILMGVGLASMTLLHWAEELAGRKMFRRWANNSDGIPIEVTMGGCSDGFEQLAPRLRAPHAALDKKQNVGQGISSGFHQEQTIERRIMVGSSLWRAFPAMVTAQVAAAAIQREPQITHCGRSSCERCRDALLGGPIVP